MPLQDLTTYTEVDPGNDYTVTATKVAVVDLDRGIKDSYIYKDFGVDHFDEDITVHFDLYVTSAANVSVSMPCEFSNSLNDWDGVKYDDVGDSLGAEIFGLSGGTHYLYGVSLRAGFHSLTTPISFDEDTQYYVTLYRDDSEGLTGTFYVYLYSDSSRTILVDSQSVLCKTDRHDFRYFNAVMSYGSASTYLQTFDIENINVINHSTDLNGYNNSSFFYDFYMEA